MKQTRKEKCTRETILEEQKRLKKEPFMLDNVDKWSYYVKEEKKQEKQQYRQDKKQQYKKRNRG